MKYVSFSVWQYKYPFYLFLLQVIFAIAQNRLAMPKMYVYAHAHTLIKPGHIWVRSCSGADYHPGKGLSRSMMLTWFQPWLGRIYMPQFSFRANLFLKSSNWNGFYYPMSTKGLPLIDHLKLSINLHGMYKALVECTIW